MGRRLLPLSLDELFAHSLALERHAAARYHEYAQIVRNLGHHQLAETFEQLERDELQQVSLVERGAAGRALPEISPWEYGLRLVIPAGMVKHRSAEPPQSADKAIAMALAGERRAEAFYCDVAAHASDGAVKSLAAMFANDERRHIEQLEGLLGRKLGPVELDRDTLKRRAQHRYVTGRSR